MDAPVGAPPPLLFGRLVEIAWAELGRKQKRVARMRFYFFPAIAEEEKEGRSASSETLPCPFARFQGFGCAIFRRACGVQRCQQAAGGVGDFIDRAVECGLVDPGRM